MAAAIDTLRGAATAGREALNEAEGKALLAAAGVAVPRAVTLGLDADVEAALADLGGPFAVKIMSPDILHKSDVGGVRVGLADAGAVRAAIDGFATSPAIAAALAGGRLEGYLVEEMAPPGREVVIGGLHDPQFGAMLMVGLGGVFVEVLKDVSFRICPITAADAAAMLDELRGAALLDGVRGQAGVSREAIVAALLALGGEDGLLSTHGDCIAEMDVNPLIVSASGAVAVDARFVLRQPTPVAPEVAPPPRGELPVLERFAPLFRPATVAVVGASTTSTSIANTFIRRLKAFGYAGEIYPIHPKAERVEDLPAHATLASTPRPVDYAYVAIGAERIPALLGGCAGNVRFAQVISSGFREVADGVALERDLVAQAHAAGCRVIGPNCLGMYSPRGGVTFPVDAPREAGGVGVICQSGGLGTDIVKRGQARGLGFSALLTIGNSADLGPADLLEYFLADADTHAIGLYVEDVRAGRRFFELLRTSPVRKPLVLMKGGRSRRGLLAAASHTGALAGDGRAWEALTRQTPVVFADTVDQFIGALLALEKLRLRSARPTTEVVLFGNGGGTSVLATDYFDGLGLAVSPFAPAAHAALEAMQLPPGTSVANPIDTPVRTLQEDDGRIAAQILELVYQHAAPDALVMHLNLAAFVGRGDIDPVGNLVQAALDLQARYPGQAHFLLVLRSDGSQALDDARRAYRERALAAGIPVYDELADAAHALAAVRHLEARLGTPSS